jgi:hypothetical protein
MRTSTQTKYSMSIRKNNAYNGHLKGKNYSASTTNIILKFQPHVLKIALSYSMSLLDVYDNEEDHILCLYVNDDSKYDIIICKSKNRK